MKTKTRFPTPSEVCDCLELISVTEMMSNKKAGKLIYKFTHIRKHKDRCNALHADWIEKFWKVYARAQELNK